VKQIYLFVLVFSFCCATKVLANDVSYIEAWYAEKFKVSSNLAKTRISIGVDAMRLAKQFENDTAVFAGSYIENSPKFKLVFNIKSDKSNPKSSDEIESRIQKIIKKNGWYLFASINKVSYSLDDLRKLQNTLKEIIKKYAVDGAKVLTLIQDGSVTLQVPKLERFKRKLQQYKVMLPTRVRLEELKSDVKLSSVFGGADANGDCTFGFVVKDAKGVKGITTAEHCGEKLSWAGIPLTHRGRILNKDTQWFELPASLQSKAKNHIVSHFYQKSPSFTSLKGTATLGIGNPVCMFGASGRRKCGIVFAVNQILAEHNPSRGVVHNYENLTIVTSNGKRDGGGLSIGGDSGGPYYIYDKAVGQVVAGDVLSSYYTPIENITALGVNILVK